LGLAVLVAAVVREVAPAVVAATDVVAGVELDDAAPHPAAVRPPSATTVKRQSIRFIRT